MSTTVLAAPLSLWNLYVEYLWNYQRDSWVDRIASTFRVLALLLITPFAILTMLDVASYVIARTLGVVDATKASTGELGAHDAPVDLPSIHIDTDVSTTPATQHQGGAEAEASAYVHDGDNVVAEGNPRLAGVDAFSPAPSQPSSPTLSRKDLAGHMHHQQGLGLNLAPLATLPRRARSDTASSSGESKFTILERDSGSDENGDAGGMQVRRRVRAGAGEGLGESAEA